MRKDKFIEAPPECQLKSMGCTGFCESAREVERQLCRKCLEAQDAHFTGAKGDVMHFGYTNYRGEYGERRATPIRFEFGRTEHHPEDQWLMYAIDHDKGIRAFALADMVIGFRKPVLPPFADVNEVKYRFPNTSPKAVRRIAELEQMVADLVVTGASMTLADMDVPGRFTHWNTNIREQKQLGDTVNMTTERKTAYTAGFTSGLGCGEKENQDLRLQCGGMQQELIELREKLVIIRSKAQVAEQYAQLGRKTPNVLNEIAELCKLE